jgi:hypothetical protein
MFRSLPVSGHQNWLIRLVPSPPSCRARGIDAAGSAEIPPPQKISRIPHNFRVGWNNRERRGIISPPPAPNSARAYR